MKKKDLKKCKNSYADTLLILYKTAGIDLPDGRFYPEQEAARITSGIMAKTMGIKA